MLWLEGEVDGVECDGGDAGVGAFVGPVLVNGKDLEEADLVLCGPIDPFSHGKGVADAEIAGAAGGEGGDEKTGCFH